MVDLFGNQLHENVLLREKFIEPPFSVLDAKSASWQKRKQQWKGLGIISELGRGKQLFSATLKKWADKKRELGLLKGNKLQGDVSIFDPALCEVLYHWFVPAGGAILDPFAGGSVRGIVANYLGYNYYGIDIRQEQIDSNRNQALNILPIGKQPQYYVGDSNVLLDGDWNLEFDFVFSCPPYVNLEVYSDLE